MNKLDIRNRIRDNTANFVFGAIHEGIGSIGHWTGDAIRDLGAAKVPISQLEEAANQGTKYIDNNSYLKNLVDQDNQGFRKFFKSAGKSLANHKYITGYGTVGLGLAGTAGIAYGGSKLYNKLKPKPWYENEYTEPVIDVFH